MDASNPAVFVNGDLLSRYVGQRVRAVVQMMRSDVGSVIGKSTDDQQIVFRGSPLSQLANYVEVIRVAEGNNAIRAEIWTKFGNTLDTCNYNELCQLANGELKHLFI